MTQDLDRFVSAQSGVYASAVAELRRGRKTGHWMWFVFPQIAGLGRSTTAQFYAIRDLVEAQAYLAHALLGVRLLETTAAVIAAPGDATAILGEIDAIKLRSSMTLFAAAARDAAPFEAALDRFYAGQRDPATLAILAKR